MNEEDNLFLSAAIVILFVAVGCFFLGKAEGVKIINKPCNQYTQWQIQQKLEPVKCLKAKE